MIEPSAEGNEIDTSCSKLGAQSCSTPSPIGGGAMGWFGYAWHPVGIEAFIAGQYDQTSPSATFIGSTSAITNPLLIGQPHVEQFGFIRYGGVAAVRARLSHPEQSRIPWRHLAPRLRAFPTSR